MHTKPMHTETEVINMSTQQVNLNLQLPETSSVASPKNGILELMEDMHYDEILNI